MAKKFLEVWAPMTDRMPTTRISLLAGLRDTGQYQTAWREFNEVYRPAIYRYARRRGLQSATAEDLTQQVLLAAAKKLPEWDNEPGRGSLRAWLLTVTRNLLINEITRRQPHQQSTTPLEWIEELNRQSTLSSLEPIDWEYRRALFREAAAIVSAQVSPIAWQCFWQTSVEGNRAALVAQELGISFGLVYTNRCRVLQRLQAYIADRQREDIQ